jgi:hypothetical protein
MSTGLSGEAGIVVRADGSRHSRQALRWGAHLAALVGFQPEAVLRGLPAQYLFQRGGEPVAGLAR